MNKILFAVLILVLVAHFFYKELPKFKPLKDEQNFSVQKRENLGFDDDDTFKEPEFTDLEKEPNVFIPTEQALDDDELDLDTILPNLKDLINQLKPEDKSFVVSHSNLLSYVKELESFVYDDDTEKTYLDASELPIKPKLTKQDLKFSSKKLSTKLFEPNKAGKKLWQNAKNWELWKKNERANKRIYTLLGGFYLYQNEQESGYLSDELSISLQKSAHNSYFISIITPTHYENKLIQDFTSVDDYFVFKVGERKFIIAYLFNRDFTLWWDCELTNKGLKATPIASNLGFSVYSSDTNAYEMRLSEDGMN